MMRLPGRKNHPLIPPGTILSGTPHHIIRRRVAPILRDPVFRFHMMVPQHPRRQSRHQIILIRDAPRKMRLIAQPLRGLFIRDTRRAERIQFRPGRETGVDAPQFGGRDGGHGAAERMARHDDAVIRVGVDGFAHILRDGVADLVPGVAEAAVDAAVGAPVGVHAEGVHAEHVPIGVPVGLGDGAADGEDDEVVGGVDGDVARVVEFGRVFEFREGGGGGRFDEGAVARGAG